MNIAPSNAPFALPQRTTVLREIENGDFLNLFRAFEEKGKGLLKPGKLLKDAGRAFASERRVAGYPFTTPSIRPLKKSFWAKVKAMMPGNTTIM